MTQSLITESLHTNPYIQSQDYFNMLDSNAKKDFLESLYTLLTTQKAIIFSKFIESHPYFESYLMQKDLSDKHLSLLSSSYHIIHATLQIPQSYLPNIIFYDKHKSTDSVYRLGVLPYEPFSASYRDTLTKKLQQSYKEEFIFYLCKQDFLKEINLALQLQQYCQKDELQGNFVESLVSFGLTMQASDIHLFLQDSKAFCLLRIDGILVHFLDINTTLFAKISQKLKLLCKLDINEMRLPQDGHLKLENLIYKNDKRDCDVRLSFMPTLRGESIVLRIPHANRRFESLDTLGLSVEILEILKKALLTKSGLILISGPTGSGKSTLLYNCLRFLHNGTKKIITIEDPIEQEIQGITQTQVNEELSFDFAKALKYILRQDPDIIMIGEIRDNETLDIALRAALTGHLVMASIHSSDCKSSLARLYDLGAKEYILQTTLKLIISQRLIQTLCPVCKEEIQGRFHARGCHECYGQGYGKRILLQEVFDFSIHKRLDSKTLMLEDESFIESLYQGIPTLEKQSQKLFKDGIISYEESLL